MLGIQYQCYSIRLTMDGNGYWKTWRMTNMVTSMSNNIQSLTSCLSKTMFK